jgi:hypothetical protein
VPEPSSVLIVRDDGVIDVPGAIPVIRGLVEAVEQLVNSLGIPTRDEREPPAQQT